MSFLVLLPYVGSAISGIMLSETVRYFYTQCENDVITTDDPQKNKHFHNSLLCDIKSFNRSLLNQEKQQQPSQLTLLDELKIKLKEKRKVLEYN